jgi:hypothetical protein
MSIANNLLDLYTNTDAALKHCNEKLTEKRVEAASTLYEVADKITTLKADYGKLIDGTITEIKIPFGTWTVRPYAFYDCKNLTTIYMGSTVQTIGDYAFYNCSSVATIGWSDSSVKTIGDYAFYGCSNLALDKDFLWVTENIGKHAFEGCTNIDCIKFYYINSIDDYAFAGCENLDALIIARNNGRCSLSNPNALEGTPIAQGTGYIYVPSSRISSYQSAENWSQYASQFRVLEEYTVDGTINGDLDESKI